MRSPSGTRTPTLFIVMAAVLLAGCTTHSTISGQGQVHATEYPLLTVKHVDISGKARINLYQSDRSELVVHAQENVLDTLEITVANDKLTIQPSRGMRFSSRTPLTYDLYLSNLETFRISGNLDLHSERFETPDLAVTMSGSTKANLQLVVGNLEVDSAGSADIRLSGHADLLNIEAAGSADIDARDMQANDVRVETAGSARVDVWAMESLTVRAAGSARIRYLGRPYVEQRLAGSASVRRLED